MPPAVFLEFPPVLLSRSASWMGKCPMYRVSENTECKMSVDNLAMVFGPTVVGYASAEPTMEHIMSQTKLQQLVNTSFCIHLTFAF